MKRRERALTALEIREPDRVPIFELGIDPPHMEKITGRKIIYHSRGEAWGTTTIRNTVDTRVECWNKLGFDLIRGHFLAPEGFRAKTLPDGSFIDEWGMIIAYDPRAGVWVYKTGTLKTQEDYEAHPFPDPHAPGRVTMLEYLIKKVKGEMAVAGCTRSPFALTSIGFHVESFFRLIRKKPQFIKKVIGRISDFNIEAIKIMVDAGVDLIICTGDIAEKNGPLMSPKYFRDLVYPNIRREVNIAHKKGVKYIKHTDGNINPILDGLVNEARVDGLHSLDPSAGMDIGMVKHKYGDRLVLMGNIAVDTLALGSKEDVIKETKECIRRAAPNGGYFLSSSNTWYANAKLENCLAMVETGRKYGKYPIRI